MTHTAHRTRILRGGVASAGVLVLAVTLSGCASVSSLLGGAERDAETEEVTQGGSESVFDIKPGDCLADPQSDEVSDIEVVPCGEEHDYELYHEFTTEHTEWPGSNEAFDDEAFDGCGSAFAEFVGLPFEESPSLWFTWFTPTQQSWENGDDRTIQCMVYKSDDDQGSNVVPVTGTLEDSQQ